MPHRTRRSPQRLDSRIARLDAAFTRVSPTLGFEIQADLSKYLCVLVSGFFEAAVEETLFSQFFRNCP